MNTISFSNRYIKQILLKEINNSGQRKLSESKVLVIGAGGIGCPVLSYLAAAGTGLIGIMDFDKVDMTNLHRQVLFNESQIRFSKAEAAAENLCKINSEIIYKVYNIYLNTKAGFEILKEYDVIFDATDNFRSRYLINDLCVNLGKPFVMGSVNKFEGQVAVLNYNNGPTYRCYFPEFPNSKLIKNCEESGVIGPLCGLIGSIAATEVIKLITGAGEMLSGELLIVNSLNMEFRKIKSKRDQSSVEMAYKLKGKISDEN